MHHRGRSRHVSPVALARQASEERKQPRRPPVTDNSVCSSVHPSTPPTQDPDSQSQSLEDQIQVAYANDNIRLAKTLLLRLKGIHVSDDSDPRIDQVRDEDFDICFAPSGPLPLDDAFARAVQEYQHRHRQSWHQSQRAQRLRACERLWEDEKSRLHDQKRRLRQPDLSPQKHRVAKPRPDPPSPSAMCGQDPFQYSFMRPSIPHKSAKKTSANAHHRAVSFKEVISAMNGKLFPPDPSERADDARRIAGLPIPNTSAHRRRASLRAELLDSLLQVVEWQQGDRRSTKGKDVDRTAPPHHRTPPTPVPSSVSATCLSPSSSPSRSNSWLAFGSWRSTATDITTPDSPGEIMPSPLSHSCLLPTLVESQRDLCPRSAFVHTSLQDSPLCPPPISSSPCDGHTSSSAAEIFSSVGIRQVLVRRVTRSVATIVEAARGLQSVYITATMITAGHPYQNPDTSQPRRSSRCQHQPRREGYRALPKDVQRFTDGATPISHICGPVHFIPLASLSSGNVGLSKPPASKSAIIFPSPLRPRTPPAALAYRMRPVANPAVLRLKALQNLMCARGKEWQGRAREGGLGCGKERMLGIAFEGRGRSGLGCEVRFVVA